MDPNATLRLIDEALKNSGGTVRDVVEPMYVLRDWIAAGGFGPHWAMYPSATKAYADYFEIPYSRFYGAIPAPTKDA